MHGIGISFFILLNSNGYLASLELSLSANLYTHLVAYAFSILKNSALSSFANFQLQWGGRWNVNNKKHIMLKAKHCSHYFIFDCDDIAFNHL